MDGEVKSMHNAQWGERGGQRAEKIFMLKFFLSAIKYVFYFTARWKGKVGERVWNFHVLSRSTTFPNPHVFTNQKALEPCPLGFYGGFIT